MSNIDIRYNQPGGYEFASISKSYSANLTKNNPENPKITYKKIDYVFESIGFKKTTRDNSGQLFLIHKNPKSQKPFVFVINVLPTSANNEPSLESYLIDPIANPKIDLAKLIGNYLGKSMSVKSNTDTNEFSCVIGTIRLAKKPAVDKFKTYVFNDTITSAHSIDSDNGILRSAKNPTKKETRICKRVATEDNPIEIDKSRHTKYYATFEGLSISFMVLFGVFIGFICYMYFTGAGYPGTVFEYPLLPISIAAKNPDTDFFNNPFSTMMGGRKNTRIRLGKK